MHDGSWMFRVVVMVLLLVSVVGLDCAAMDAGGTTAPDACQPRFP